jgi:hypothetical protein
MLFGILPNIFLMYHTNSTMYYLQGNGQAKSTHKKLINHIVLTKLVNKKILIGMNIYQLFFFLTKLLTK